MLLFISLLLLGMGGLFLPAASDMNEYYVTPTPGPNPDCPAGKPCHTLYEYARDNSSYFGNQANASLIFLRGVHNLNRSLDIMEMHQLILTGEKAVSNREYPEVVIDCGCETAVNLIDIRELSFEGLSFNFSIQEFRSFNIKNVTYFKQINTSIHLMQTYMVLQIVASITIFQSENINGHIAIFEYPSTENKVYITESTLIGLEMSIVGEQSGEVFLDTTIEESNVQGSVTINSVGHLTLSIGNCNISGGDIMYSCFAIVIPSYDATEPYTVYAVIEDTSFKDIENPVMLSSTSHTSNIVLIILQCDFFNTTAAIMTLGNDVNLQLMIQDSSFDFASGAAIYIIPGGNMTAEIIIHGTTISNCFTGLELYQFSDNNSSLIVKRKDSEIVNSSLGFHMASDGEIDQTDITIIHCKISNCDVALQLLADSNSLRLELQDSEIVNSSRGISLVNQAENGQTDVTIVNSIISNN